MMAAAPRPSGEISPPASDVPPMIATANEMISQSDPIDGWAEPTRVIQRKPAMAAKTPESTLARTVTRSVRMPDSRAASPLPPADWAGPAFDDSVWARLYWPQPEWEEINAQENGSKVRAPNPYDTVVLLARRRFVISDPAQVKACRLSLDYWGGVVVYVNGKEAARSHLTTLPGGKTNLFDNVANPGKGGSGSSRVYHK